MQDAELFLSLAGIAGVFVGFGALISVRSGGPSGAYEVSYIRCGGVARDLGGRRRPRAGHRQPLRHHRPRPMARVQPPGARPLHRPVHR